MVKAGAAGDMIENTEAEKKNQPKTMDTKESVNYPQVSEVSEPSGRDFLLFYEGSGDKIGPEDYKIGELQTIFIDEEILKIIETADSFLSSIVAGRLNSDLIESGRRDFVSRNLEEEMRMAIPDEYRLGTILTKTDPVRAEVRFIKENGSSEGIIYFVKTSKWEVYDLHMDFDKMNELFLEDDEEYLWESVSAE